jgi:hypothetical protein
MLTSVPTISGDEKYPLAHDRGDHGGGKREQQHRVGCAAEERYEELRAPGNSLQACQYDAQDEEKPEDAEHWIQR